MPCTYGRPAQPQHPMRARTCTYSSGRVTGKEGTLPAAGLGQAGPVGFFLRHSQQNVFPGLLSHAGGFLGDHTLVWYLGTCAFGSGPSVLWLIQQDERNHKVQKATGDQQLIHVPCKHWKKMSLVVTCVIKRSGGGCERQGPSAMVHGPQTGISSTHLGQIARRGADSVYLSELRYISKSEPKMNDPAMFGKHPFSLSHPPGAGLEQDMRRSGEL